MEAYDIPIFASLTNPQYRIVSADKIAVWDFSTGAMSASGTFAHSCNVPDIHSVFGGYPIKFPAALPVGSYYLIILDSASPAYTDEVKIIKRFRWDGSVAVDQPTFLDV